MVVFRDIDDVKEWLSPLDYVAFWEAVEPYAIFLDEDREHCDGLIAKGDVSSDLILDCLKAMARDTIRDRFGLDHRRYRHLAGDAGGLLH